MSRDEKLHSNATTSSSKLTSKPFSKSSQKFRSAGQPAGQTSRMLGNRYSPNPQDTTTDPFVPAPRFPEKRKLDENDRSSVSDNDDSVHSNDEKLKPAPGKKTRGRVKIQMEYIQNKLRRYTTFSKRKSGIMKKAYELSTLTGTQVMLLVASETGHVYTFATPKLQPMITSEAGKALIQTCLHSPEPPPAISNVGDYDMRMNVSGYEETELGYNMSDEDYKHNMNNCVVSGSSQMTAVLNPVVSIPQQMMQIPFSAQEGHSMASNYVMTPSHPIQPVQPLAPSSQVLSPHHSPPSYSPPLQPTTSPSTYTPPYPGSPSYSQASHMPPQPVMLDELGSPSHISGSPLRKSPEHHYLGTHGMDGYDRSPSRSPIQNRYGSPHMYSAPTSSPPMSGHSPLRQL